MPHKYYNRLNFGSALLKAPDFPAGSEEAERPLRLRVNKLPVLVSSSIVEDHSSLVRNFFSPVSESIYGLCSEVNPSSSSGISGSLMGSSPQNC